MDKRIQREMKEKDVSKIKNKTLSREQLESMHAFKKVCIEAKRIEMLEKVNKRNLIRLKVYIVNIFSITINVMLI